MIDLQPFRHIEIPLGDRLVSLAQIMEALRILYPTERVVITVSDTRASIELFHDAPEGILVEKNP